MLLRMAPWHTACRHYNKSEQSTVPYFGFTFSGSRIACSLKMPALGAFETPGTSNTKSHIHKFLAFVGSKGASDGSKQPTTAPCQEPAESNPQVTANFRTVNPLNTELNPICYFLALLGAHHFLHVSRIRVKLLTFRLLMSYIYGAPILDVSRSHTTTQHSR